MSKRISEFTEDETPDLDADFVVTYDASASDNKRVKLRNLSAPGVDIQQDGVLQMSGVLTLDFNSTQFQLFQDSQGVVEVVFRATGTSEGDTIIFQTNTTDFKDSVAVATVSNITLSGEQTIDGVLTSASRVLVLAQNTPSQNGIYVSAAGAWSRAEDADENSEVSSGLLVLSEGGDTYSNTLFTLVTPDPVVVGSTALTFDSIVLPSNPEVLKTVTAASYTLLVSDPNKWLKMNRGTAQTIVVPAASTKIPVNSVIWGQVYGAGATTFVAGSGAVNIRSTQGLTISTQYAIWRLKKIANNEWSLTFFGERNLAVGYTASGYNAGTKSSGTFTPDPANGNLQYAVNGGAHTLAPPSTGTGNALTLIVQYTNNGSAGAITTSGFTKVDGSFTTTNGHDFMCYMTVLNGFSHLNIVALQ